MKFARGPDFRGARLCFDDGPEITGDVELHLHAGDWTAHAQDRAYDGVVLHVVLFPPPAGHVTRGADGHTIPVLALLPLLHHDLEEFAAEEAVESLAGRTAARVQAELAALAATELGALLRMHAATRWRQKVHFARLRVQRFGWDGACHHAALEILGYRFNRAPIAREICGEALGGTRLDNLVCDGFLPLLAAHTGSEPLEGLGPLSLSNGLHGLWFHWFPGDLPPALARSLRELGVFDGRVRPSCHGAAQGLLGWLIEREAGG